MSREGVRINYLSTKTAANNIHSKISFISQRTSLKSDRKHTKVTETLKKQNKIEYIYIYSKKYIEQLNIKFILLLYVTRLLACPRLLAFPLQTGSTTRPHQFRSLTCSSSTCLSLSEILLLSMSHVADHHNLPFYKFFLGDFPRASSAASFSRSQARERETTWLPSCMSTIHRFYKKGFFYVQMVFLPPTAVFFYLSVKRIYNVSVLLDISRAN